MENLNSMIKITEVDPSRGLLIPPPEKEKSRHCWAASMALVSSRGPGQRMRGQVLLRQKIGEVKEKLMPVSALVCFARIGGEVWKWNLSEESYDQVHGLAQIAREASERLQTAKEINAENLPDFQDNGTSMVDYLLNLLNFYREKTQAKRELEEIALQARKNVTEGEEFHVAFKLRDDAPIFEQEGLSFTETLVTLGVRLQRFKGALLERSSTPYIFTSHRACLDLCVDILHCCYAYLCFVHPVWVETRRSQEAVSLQLMQRVCDSLGEKLATCRCFMFRAFDVNPMPKIKAAKPVPSLAKLPESFLPKAEAPKARAPKSSDLSKDDLTKVLASFENITKDLKADIDTLKAETEKWMKLYQDNLEKQGGAKKEEEREGSDNIKKEEILNESKDGEVDQEATTEEEYISDDNDNEKEKEKEEKDDAAVDPEATTEEDDDDAENEKKKIKLQ